jgi:D-alanyl-D-alanine carboxypeptidase
VILQLEAEGKLTIDQTVGHWLPQYPAWKRVTIARLLNMTSDIPSYDNVPQMLRDYVKDPKRNFTIPELIAYVYPGNPNAPPPTRGYHYSNTNYLLAQLIIERVSHDSYANELKRRFIQNLGLHNTYYEALQYPPEVTARMPAGYFFDHGSEASVMRSLLGSDTKYNTVSWMQGAGGIVSTTEDLTRWARALYTGPILAPRQRAELFSLVSMKTGKPIAQTSKADPQGFGLGVVQATDPAFGTVWFYQGETFGYRVLYFYFPRQDGVIALGVNSAPTEKDNHAGKLALTIYNTLKSAGRL